MHGETHGRPLNIELELGEGSISADKLLRELVAFWKERFP